MESCRQLNGLMTAGSGVDVLAYRSVLFINTGHLSSSPHQPVGFEQDLNGDHENGIETSGCLPVQEERLLDLDREQTVIFDEAFQLITYHAFANTSRRPCKYKVPDINRKVVGNIRDDLIEAVDHHVGVSLLHQLLILV